MKAIIVGTDQSLRAALEAHGIETVVIDGAATSTALESAGIETADLLFVTDVGESTAVPIAKARNESLRIVIYSAATMPDFVRGQVDFALDPSLLDPEVVAEELVEPVD